MDNSVIIKTLNDHGVMLEKHGDDIGELKLTNATYCQQRVDHCVVLDEHDKRLNIIEVKEGIMITKLDTTNKVLWLIFGAITTGLVGLLYAAVQKILI